MNGAPSSNAGKAAFRRLPENEQVQYLQKIALMRKKIPPVPDINDMVEANFLHEVQFSAAIEAAHFPAIETGH